MADLQELATRRIGPFPVWAWVGIIVAGVVVARQMQGGALFGGDPEPAPEPRDPFVSDPGVSFGGTVFPGGPDRSGAPPAEPTDETNQEWLATASRRLADEFDALEIDQALRRYLQGEGLTQKQAEIVSRAIAVAGVPPEGAPPANVEPVPTAPSPSPLPELPVLEPTEPDPSTSFLRVVQDNVGRLWVIDLTTLTRWEIRSQSLLDEATSRYGNLLTRKDQLPPKAAEAQDECWIERLGRNPTSLISLDSRCGWNHAGDWRP